MSKTTLKKIIMKMDNEQLVSLILDIYNAKKEAKDYLDFFANPDIEQRIEKAKNIIKKSVIRLKRGILKPRMKTVKDAVKSISSLSPGEEYVAEIMTFAFEQFCIGAMFGRIQDATLRSIIRHLKETVIYVDSNGLSNIFIPRIEKTIESLKTDYMFRREFKNLMTESLKIALENSSSDIFKHNH